MSRSKAIMLALGTLWEAAQPAALTKRVKAISASRNQLMNIALMSNVKNNVVMRRRKNTMNGKRKLEF